MSADAGGTALSDERLAMLAALVNGDVSLAYRLATELLAHGVGFDEIVGDVFGPVQAELGARWAAGDIVVADEHAASAAVEDLIIRLGATVEAPTGPAVVVAAAERDTHALGARVVASALSLDGFRVLFLGASVPAEDLGDYLEVQAATRARAQLLDRRRALRREAMCCRRARGRNSGRLWWSRAQRVAGAGVRCGRIRALAARRGRPTPDVVARGTRATRPGTAAGTGAAGTRGSQSPPHRDRTGSGAER